MSIVSSLWKVKNVGQSLRTLGQWHLAILPCQEQGRKTMIGGEKRGKHPKERNLASMEFKSLVDHVGVRDITKDLVQRMLTETKKQKHFLGREGKSRGPLR